MVAVERVVIALCVSSILFVFYLQNLFVEPNWSYSCLSQSFQVNQSIMKEYDIIKIDLVHNPYDKSSFATLMNIFSSDIDININNSQHFNYINDDISVSSFSSFPLFQSYYYSTEKPYIHLLNPTDNSKLLHTDLNSQFSSLSSSESSMHYTQSTSSYYQNMRHKHHIKQYNITVSTKALFCYDHFHYMLPFFRYISTKDNSNTICKVNSYTISLITNLNICINTLLHNGLLYILDFDVIIIHFFKVLYESDIFYSYQSVGNNHNNGSKTLSSMNTLSRNHNATNTSSPFSASPSSSSSPSSTVSPPKGYSISLSMTYPFFHTIYNIYSDVYTSYFTSHKRHYGYLINYKTKQFYELTEKYNFQYNTPYSINTKMRNYLFHLQPIIPVNSSDAKDVYTANDTATGSCEVKYSDGVLDTAGTADTANTAGVTVEGEQEDNLANGHVNISGASLGNNFIMEIFGSITSKDIIQLCVNYIYRLYLLSVIFAMYFVLTTLVAFTLRESQLKMLKFTMLLHVHVQHQRSIYQLVTSHITETLIFVPVIVGVLFFLFEFYNHNYKLAFLVMSLVWIAEVFSVASLRTHGSIRYFPKVFALYFLFLHVYIFYYPYGFTSSALFICGCCTCHLILWCLIHHELPALESGIITAIHPRQRHYNSIYYFQPYSQQIPPSGVSPPASTVAPEMTSINGRGGVDGNVNRSDNSSTLETDSGTVTLPQQTQVQANASIPSADGSRNQLTHSTTGYIPNHNINYSHHNHHSNGHSHTQVTPLQEIERYEQIQYNINYLQELRNDNTNNNNSANSSNISLETINYSSRNSNSDGNSTSYSSSNRDIEISRQTADVRPSDTSTPQSNITPSFRQFGSRYGLSDMVNEHGYGLAHSDTPSTPSPVNLLRDADAESLYCLSPSSRHIHLSREIQKTEIELYKLSFPSNMHGSDATSSEFALPIPSHEIDYSDINNNKTTRNNANNAITTSVSGASHLLQSTFTSLESSDINLDTPPVITPPVNVTRTITRTRSAPARDDTDSMLLRGGDVPLSMYGSADKSSTDVSDESQKPSPQLSSIAIRDSASVSTSSMSSIQSYSYSNNSCSCKTFPSNTQSSMFVNRSVQRERNGSTASTVSTGSYGLKEYRGINSKMELYGDDVSLQDTSRERKDTCTSYTVDSPRDSDFSVFGNIIYDESDSEEG